MNQLIQSIKILDDKELQQVNSYIEIKKSLFETSTLMKDDGTQKTTNDLKIRSSTAYMLDDRQNVSKLIHAGMERGLQTYRDRVKKLSMMFSHWPIPGSTQTFFGRENIQLLRYLPGQKYEFHHDQADFQDQVEYFRTISTVLYLNDDFEGGGTAFPHKTFKPKAGHALFFPSNWCYPHSGTEVISGEKRVAVTWWYAIREVKG